MKIITYVLGALLAAALVAAALFYFMTFKPIAEGYARMKEGMPEMARAKAELKKYKEKESQETKEIAWVGPAAESANTALADEIKAGKAEVVADGSAVVINITETEIFAPESKTFANMKTPSKLAALLKKNELKGRDIFIGNITEPVAARGKGRKQTLPKDALTLASERSAELVKYLVKEGAAEESLAALAYPVKTLDRGFKIKSGKTMIVIGAYPPAQTPKQETGAAKQASPASPAPQPQPKTIPIKPAQPKANP